MPRLDSTSEVILTTITLYLLYMGYYNNSDYISSAAVGVGSALSAASKSTLTYFKKKEVLSTVLGSIPGEDLLIQGEFLEDLDKLDKKFLYAFLTILHRRTCP